jgi:cytochrome c-type protein NapB
MKTMSKITIGLATAAFLFIGCGNNATPAKEAKVGSTITEEALSYRNSSLYSEDKIEVPPSAYCKTPTGASKKIARAFQDAPPMICHDVEGMLPITKANNQCLTCHTPEAAASMGLGATPIPKSHFLNMRPNNKVVNGTFKKEVDNLKNEVSVKEQGEVYEGRFNCTQCHAPQSDAKLVTDNHFQADYLSKDGASKSHWYEEVTNNLDTVGKDSDVTPEDISNLDSPAGESVFKH